MRLLVACDHLALTGGLIRFERIGRVLAEWNHELAFVTLGTLGDRGFASRLRVLAFEAAAAERWDGVIVPGGGFPDAIVAGFARLRDPRFGLRVHHFLNGPARRDAYRRVADAFEPNLILVNNRHWPEADLAAFGRPARCLVGAVDAGVFAPPVLREPRAGRLRLGAIANKNPVALLEAIDRLGIGWELHWFGRADASLLGARSDLVAAGRLVSHGVLFDEALAAYYHGLDVFCSAETSAGWCNPAAEAMACGTPLVATRHGTLAFAEHDVTAYELDAPDGAAIARAVTTLVAEPERAARLAAAGRARIRALTWERYASELLAAIRAARPAPGRGGTEPAPSHALPAATNGSEPIPEDPDSMARIAELAAAHGPLPADFDAMGYLRLHPDLDALFAHPWQGRLHYLEHGRREGRIYPSNRTRAQEKAAQAERIALVLDGLDGSGKSTVARLVAEAIGATVLHPFGGTIGALMVHLAGTGQHALADGIAHGAVAMAIAGAPPGPVVIDRHWFTASQLLSTAYRAGWEPRPFSVMTWADRPTTVARMVARGDPDSGARMTEDRIATYRRLAGELGVPLLDTSFSTPEEAASRVLAMMPARFG